MKAFPVLDYQNGENSFIYEHKGMDLRDYYAAKAMQGLIGNGAYDQSNLTGLVNYAYLVASYMMEAREK